MGSYQPDVSSIRFLTAQFLMEVGSKIARSDQLTTLDDDVLHFDALTSFFTEKDSEYRQEWNAIQKERRANDQYQEDDVRFTPDIAFRYRELRCMVRSSIRQGILYKVEPPRVEWNPKELAKP